jgi:hypothetical protein
MSIYINKIKYLRDENRLIKISYKCPFDDNIIKGGNIRLDIQAENIHDKSCHENTHGGEDEFSMNEIDELFDNIKESQENKEQMLKETKTKNVKLDQSSNKTSDVPFYMLDDMLRIKRKIQIITGIPIMTQHLILSSEVATTQSNLTYNFVINNINQKVDLKNVINNLINNISNDSENFDTINLLDSKINKFNTMVDANQETKVVSFDQLILLKLLDTDRNGNINFDVYDLNDFIDFESFDYNNKDLFYNGFIMPFFPMITRDIFQEYLKSMGNIKTIRNIYPDLVIDDKHILREISAQKQINKKFLKTAEIDKLFDKNVVKYAITKATISVKNFLKTDVNLRVLFDLMRIGYSKALGSEINYIKYRPLVGNQTYLKSYKGESFDNTNTDFATYNSILFNINYESSDEETKESITVIMYQDGSYIIKTKWREDYELNFEDIEEIAKEYINPLISIINSLECYSGMKLPSVDNVKFSNINISLFYDVKMNLDNMRKTRELMELYKQADYIQAAPYINNQLNYYVIYGMNDVDIRKIENIVNTTNYYEAFSVMNVKMKYSQLILNRVHLNFIQRFNDLKLEITNVSELEFNRLLMIFVSFLKDFKDHHLIHEKSNSSVKNLDKLKETDPELFEYHKIFNTDNVYSKVCQKPHQPAMLSESEYKDKLKHFNPKKSDLTKEEELSKHVTKYWNFSKGENVYYECPGRKYPYVQFLTGIHPKGYCLPCCKKIPAPDLAYKKNISMEKIEAIKEKDKKLDPTNKIEAHRKCSNMDCKNYEPDDAYKFVDKRENVFSRYVMTYGKSIEPNRVGELPNDLMNLFQDACADAGLDAEVSSVGYKKGGSVVSRSLHNTEITRFSHHDERFSRDSDSEESNSKSDSSSESDSILNLESVEVEGGRSNKNKSKQNKSKQNKSKQNKSKQNNDVDVTESQQKNGPWRASEIPVEIQQISHNFMREERGIKRLYLFGVEQTSNLSNMGVVFALCDMLNLTYNEVFTRLEKYLYNNSSQFVNFMNGELLNSFSDMEDLLINMKKDFTVKFHKWSDLFLECLDEFNLYPILFEESLSGDVNLVIPGNINNYRDMIYHLPKRYCLIFKRQVDKVNYEYYPLYKVDLKKFFDINFANDRSNRNGLFDVDDRVIEITFDVIENMLIEKQTNNLDLSYINYLIESKVLSKYVIEKYYINKKNLCCGIIMNTNNGNSNTSFHVALEPSVIKYLSSSSKGESKSSAKIIEKIYSLKKEKLNVTYLQEFLHQLNSYLNRRNSTHTSNMHTIEKNLFIPEKILEYKNLIIGVEIHGKHFYFNEIKLNKLPNKWQQLPVKSIMYDVHTINDKIYSTNINDITLPNQYYNGLYTMHLYEILLLNVIHNFNSERNDYVRVHLKKILKDYGNINKNMEKLNELLHDFKDNLNFIKKLIERYGKNYEKIFSIIDDNHFDFDNMTIIKLRQYRQDEDVEKIIRVVDGILSKNCQITNKIDIDDFSNIITFCNSSKSYCDKGKVLITKEKMKELKQVMLKDIMNDFKFEFMFNSKFIQNVINVNEFIHLPHEEIQIIY